MNFLPAIDLKDGQCVRLVQGDMDRSTVFGDDPAARARIFADAGCTWLHMVDLNGAFAGRPVNADAVRAVLAAVDMKVELGGGIRDMKTIAAWLEAGVTRVILGTIALRDPALVRQACKEFPGRVAVGIDARDGFVAVEGWSEVSEMKAVDMARAFADAGVAAIIYTDISRDGAMQGPNTAATLELAKAVPTPIIVSGGVSSMADLEAVKQAGEGIFEGVISGRAVYDGRIDPAAAVALLEGS
ncbi:MAG: 1-(5-phosphoribosyl)-5-[(5-phosphoribosylamino)methylideneamino]imidazole-4-carboxamide isomerase [Rhodospirillales bacterium]|jgi:phosphoribosylformimino-5-aminoimidazole carboxamide ribotide isomerase|nr:1-(5-phosphoribosyl)-5-[(5-phosphoribosylamino)methylideneamino]imidazole-4-carboxamide isomerase [Rhodospirillales bacterium]